MYSSFRKSHSKTQITDSIIYKLLTINYLKSKIGNADRFTTLMECRSFSTICVAGYKAVLPSATR